MTEKNHEEQPKTRKTLEELTIVDDFMFGAVMSDPEKCKPLLEYILGVKIKKIEYPELQKTIDKRYDSKAVRLDVYVMDDKETVYNIEIQTTKKKNLPKRIRYYSGIIDMDIIDKGQDYQALKKSYVIFICTYDPFGEERYIYTFENRCLENPDIRLGDEATKIILNTEGKAGDISEELKDILRFMAGDVPKTEYAKDLEQAVDEVKKSEKWRREYMTLMMRDREKVKLGEYTKTVHVICNSPDGVSDDVLSKMLGVDEEKIYKIRECISEYPDWNDEQIAFKVLEDEEM